MIAILAWMLAALGVLWAGMGFWLLLLMLASTLSSRKAEHVGSNLHRLTILIPAHNEALLISNVVADLYNQQYPRSAMRVVVIADNCTDATAETAATAGAEVWERNNLSQVGKGFALQWAISKLLIEPDPSDAVIIMDADSFLDPGFLASMNNRLSMNEIAVQAYYTVLNADESWRTRLMTVALALVHYVRPRGRMRLGLSEGLKGNGMCFQLSLLGRFPWPGESVTEDIDYTLSLVKAGVSITFAPEAVVRAQMPVTAAQAGQQRSRWEGGRYRLLTRAIALFVNGFCRASIRQMDRAVELLIPPFVELVLIATVGGAASLALWSWSPHTTATTTALIAWFVSIVSILIYLAGGMLSAKVPMRIASSLLIAPGYMLWKIGLYAVMMLKGGPRSWERTERKSL